jgi:hypothetical protein
LGGSPLLKRKKTLLSAKLLPELVDLIGTRGIQVQVQVEVSRGKLKLVEEDIESDFNVLWLWAKEISPASNLNQVFITHLYEHLTAYFSVERD